MADKALASLGRRIFALKKQGVVVSTDVLAAARRCVEGNQSKADAELVRGVLNISRTGLGKANRDLRKMNRATSMVVNYGQSLEMIERGGSIGAAGAMKFVQLTRQNLEDLSRAKGLQTFFEKTGDKIFKKLGSTQGALYGTQAYYGLRRIVRAGGGVLSAAMMGWELGSQVQEAHYEAKMARYRTEATPHEEAVKHNIVGGRLTGEASRIRAEEEGAQSTGEYAVSWWMGGSADVEKAIQERIKRRGEQIATARALTERLGIKSADAYADYAKEKGVSVNDLNEFEKSEALDRALRIKTDPRRMLYDKQVEARIALQRTYFGELLKKLSGGRIDRLDIRSEQTKNLERLHIAEDIMGRWLEGLKQMDADKIRSQAYQEAARAESERLQQREIEAQITANWQSSRKRHQAWAND